MPWYLSRNEWIEREGIPAYAFARIRDDDGTVIAEERFTIPPGGSCEGALYEAALWAGEHYPDYFEFDHRAIGCVYENEHVLIDIAVDEEERRKSND